ncbi:MAG TPA: NAD-dependent epimerase/dehydratase family protein [Planctomycetota bacterium]|nr:NAD-dependent epimerase/dehydratase family protein [Planctomycetota bacterium]
MKALVTGSSGFVGRHLTAALRDAGWRVLTSARHGPADIRGDLLRAPLRSVSVDVVFHLAGFSNPRQSVGDPAHSYADNAEVTARLLRETRAGRYVIASTCQVYAPSEDRSSESAPLAPKNPYAASKLCAEALALASGKDVVVLRPYNHTGPGQSDAYVCPHIARQIALAEVGLGPPVVDVGSLETRRDFFDVRDMVRAYRLAAERGKAGEVYNVASGQAIAIGDVLGILMAESHVKLRAHPHRGRPDYMSGDYSKFRAATGWRPQIPLQKTLLDLLEHERKLAVPGKRST